MNKCNTKYCKYKYFENFSTEIFKLVNYVMYVNNIFLFNGFYFAIKLMCNSYVIFCVKLFYKIGY